MPLFAVVPSRVIEDPKLSLLAKAVAASLALHADQSGLCWPSRNRIAGYLGVDPRSISRAFRELATREMIEILPRFDQKTGAQRSSVIRILFDLSRARAETAAQDLLGPGEEAPPPGPGDPGGVDTDVQGGWTQMSTRTDPVEQAPAGGPPKFSPDLLTDPVHREAFDYLAKRAPSAALLVGEIQALMQGMRGGGEFSIGDIGPALADIVQKELPPTSLILKRFAQKARATRDLPDPSPRSGSDVGSSTIADLERRVAEQRAARSPSQEKAS